MIKVEFLKAFNIDGAIRGMRNPKKSWGKSDSYYANVKYDDNGYVTCVSDYIVGPKDLELMKKLYSAGTEHRKFLRQIFVSFDLDAPIYFWKQLDQYRIGVTTDSTSTMHCLMNDEISISDFSFDYMQDDMGGEFLESAFIEAVDNVERLRKAYKETGNKEIERAVYQLLPCGFNQKRTITMSYENVMNILNQRSNHKLSEWKDLCKELRTLPYVKELRGEQ